MKTLSSIALALVAAGWATPAPAQTWTQAPTQASLALPLKNNSVRFAVIGDAGTGDRSQNEVAAEITRYYQRFPFTFAILLGDNIYGSEVRKHAQTFLLRHDGALGPFALADLVVAVDTHDE